MNILGIDPGLNGAVAFLSDDEDLFLADVPTHALTVNGRDRRRLDGHSFDRLIAELAMSCHMAYIESVHSMPAQGIASAFTFGQVFGAMEQTLVMHRISYTLVEPALWKRALGVPADKDGARRRASQLMPAYAHHWPLKKHDGRAEASLIAYYGRQIHLHNPRKK